MTRERLAAGAQPPISEYAVVVIEGVVARQERIDEALQTYSQGWGLDRMPAVDRAILRIGAWELLHNPEVPGEVAIAEAVALATELSTEDSPRFVNGLLSRLRSLRETLST